MNLEGALSLIRPIEGYPKPGILFQDITPLLAHPDGFAVAIEALSIFDPEAQVIAGVEARGFILASAIAQQRGCGFIPIRKAGKLPFQTHAKSYDLEYGVDSLEIHIDALSHHKRVLLVDDVLATGGTLDAALELIKVSGGFCTDVVVLMEIESLGGRQKLLSNHPDIRIHALVTI